METNSKGQEARWETLLLTADLVNLEQIEPDIARKLLSEYGFVRASSASQSSLSRLIERVETLAPLFRDIPKISVEQAGENVNEALLSVPITPIVAAHDGLGPHMHWTDNTAGFDDQVIADMLISLAFELCENGVERFGICAAVDCESLFFDTSRNRSRRFCADPRCASRTHTADHRARQAAAEESS